MTKFYLAFLLYFLPLISYSQTTRITTLLKQPEVKTSFYEMTEAGGWVLYLPMDFGKSEFTYLQEGAIQKLKDANIARVDLVYSDYPAGQDFLPLTKKRYESLYKILPSLFADINIEFSKVRQTIAKTKKTAESLQHGFFIYFRPKPAKEEAKKELGKLKEMLKPVKEEIALSETKVSKEDSLNFAWCGTSTVLVDTTDLLTDTSYSNFWKIPREVHREVTGMTIKEYVKSKLRPEINEKDYEGFDSVFHIKFGRDCPEYSSEYFLYQLTDTTVSAVFKRHRWNSALIIGDVTGSMYPYTGQLLQWLKLTMTDKAKRHFIFFNDGDNKEDKEKVIGKTGGIYSVFTGNYDEVEKTIEKTMMNGGGGDAPENNIEALFEAGKLCPSCDSIVMIADNWAPVKDISLLTSAHKPVKVILCGVLGKIHKDYLKLVRDTGGSLHLVEEDIYNLSELKEGETIKIHGVLYKLIKGEFVSTETKML